MKILKKKKSLSILTEALVVYADDTDKSNKTWRIVQNKISNT